MRLTLYQDALRFFLRKTFDLREGEILRAILMQLYIFLIICTLLIVKPAVYSLFVSQYGVESLPIVFVMVAVTAAVVSTFYSRVLARVQLNRIIVGTLYSSVFMLVALGLLLTFNFLTGWILYVFYLWVAIFALLATSQFWILANIVFNAREAKRLFGFIGAGAIAGGIFGGYLTSFLTNFMSSKSLLFVCAILLSLCIPITKYIWKHNVAPSQAHVQQKKRMGGDPEHPFKLIINSRHLTFMAIIIGVSVIVAKLVEYQFTAISSRHFPNPDDLTSFFGFWFSTLNIISLLIQLFVTHRVVGVYGVGTSLFFLPGGIMIGALLLVFFPFLWAAVFIKIADGSLKQSINKSATELLALPIPLEIKNRTKSFIDIFIDSFATGIGGLILIFLVRGLNLPTYAISLMILVLISIWVYFAYLIREEYLNSFKLRVGAGKEDPEKKLPDLTNESVFGGLMRVLESGSDKQILFVLSKINEIQDEKLFEHIRSLLHHPSPAVRAEALRTIYFYKNDSVVADVEPMVHDEDQNVKIEAFEYLLEHSGEDRVSRMESYLRDPDFRVRGAALVSLALETRDNPGLMRRFDLEGRIEACKAEIRAETDLLRLKILKTNLIKAIGQASLKSQFHVLIAEIEDQDADVAATAIEAAGNTLHLSFIPVLVDMLGDERLSAHARDALVHYGHGIVQPIMELLQLGDARVEILRMVPSVFERIDSQRSVDYILELIDFEDVTVQLEALRSLNALKANFPHLRFNKKAIMQRILEETKLYQDTLSILYAQIQISSGQSSNGSSNAEKNIEEARLGLVKLLERRMDSSLERIFRLLGLKYPPEDILPIFEGLQSKKPDLRVNAVEFLENLLEPSLKKVLIPIIETALLDGLSQDAIRNLNINIPDEYECYDTLLNGKDIKLKLAVLYLIGQLQDPRFITLAENYASNENHKIKTFAENAIDAFQQDGN